MKQDVVMSGIESAVRERYAQASQKHEPCLCVPSGGYDDRYLRVLPPEIIQRDYGCGDPSKYVREGETVLDLGSGAGKICYICAQKVGPGGRVIGVDFNQPILDLARKHQQSIGEQLGYHNVEFRKGKIQDLKLDLDVFEQWLREHPAGDADAYLRAQECAAALSRERPMIADESIDLIVSNCVLNLVATEQKKDLFDEMFRVLRTGGRCVISDIVCDEDVPRELQADPALWSGCISGAFREEAFLEAFEMAGFHGMRIVERSEQPWQTIRGIEFRSITVEAFKGKQGKCIERNQAVIYKGPWKRVVDDDGHTLTRGRRMAVCAKTFGLYQHGPYAEQLHFIEPRIAVTPEQAKPFDCRSGAVRHPRQTKGLDYDVTSEPGACCGGDGCC